LLQQAVPDNQTRDAFRKTFLPATRHACSVAKPTLRLVLFSLLWWFQDPHMGYLMLLVEPLTSCLMSWQPVGSRPAAAW
jgi:hypothetical protein